MVVTKECLIGKKMIEILQFLFATDRDGLLYNNQDNLIKELINEYNFGEDDIKLALAWFEPIMSEKSNLQLASSSIRSFSNWEEECLPKKIINQIFEWENTHAIDVVEREILFDRLGELCLDWQLPHDELQEILEGLIYHIQNYKQHTLEFDVPKSPFYWAASSYIH